MAERLYNRREEAQIRRCLALLERIRFERTTEQQRDDETHPAYHAAVAIYGIEDLLGAVKEADDREAFNAFSRALIGEDVL